MTLPENPSSFLLIAPPGSGKTRFCLDLVRETLANSPLAPIWMVVRDRLQAAAYRQMLQQSGLGFGVEVATFGDLYKEILGYGGRMPGGRNPGGGGLPVAEEPALHALIQSIVEEAHAAGRLEHFARLREFPGFITVLSERFAEFKRALVVPERLAGLALARSAPGRASALEEIAGLYAAYQRRLRELGWADQEGVTWLGLEALRADPGMLREVRLVIVDGFDSFNPAQRQTLQALAGRVQELWITLPGAAEMRRPAHRRFERALGDLLEHISLQVVSLDPASQRPAVFAELEARLFEPPEPALTSGCEQVCLLEAQSPDEEAREALRWLKARIVRDGLPPSGCALIVPDFAVYRTAILAAAAEFGLPLRMTHAARLIDTPPMAALLDLLFLPVRNVPLRLLLDTVRAPFFDFSSCDLRREDAKLLEIVSRYGQIFEGMQPWHEVLGELARVEPTVAAAAASGPVDSGPNEDDEEPEEGQAVPELPKGETAARLDRGLQSLFELIAPSSAERPLDEWVRWLAECLDAVGLAQNCTRGVERQWLESLRKLLGALANSGRLSGRRACSYTEFLADLQSLLANAPAADDLPAAEGLPGGEQTILVLHTFEARGLRFQAAALVGLAEGLFPSVEREDPFLSDSVRAELGMDARLGQDQAGIFYQMVTRADESLLLTRPYLAKDGESWEPSPFWSAVQEVVGRQALRVRPEDNRPLCDAASQEELVFWAARRTALTGGALEEPFAAQLQERYLGLRHAQQVLAERIDHRDGAPYHGDLSLLADALHDRFGSLAVWSASRLESYATCPFSFLVGSALGLELIRPPKAGFETFQLGSLLHEALEQIYRACPEPDNADAVLAGLPEVAGRVFEEAPRKYAFRPTLLWEMQKAELVETLRAAVTGLAALDAGAGWQPQEYERRFGIDGAPFLEIQVNGQPVRLRGVIDRIDRNGEGHLRVIDYKSGGSHLAAPDLIEGRRLQLPLYALAAQQALGLGRVAEGIYWKLFAQEPGSLRLSRFQCELGEGPQAAYALAEQHVERLVSGIRSGVFSPRPPDGGCPSYCPASSWCWSYQPKAVY